MASMSVLCPDCVKVGSAAAADRTAGATRERWRRGFTLIEILVVVAIIALLIAILLPSFKKARDNAKLTVCKSNLHDIGVAMGSYSVEYKGWFPPAPYMGSTLWLNVDNPGADDNLYVLWQARLAKDVNIFTCPATRHKVRIPSKVERIPTSLGFKYVIHTAGSSGHVNDFERLGQYAGTNGNGTSYEYGVWHAKAGMVTDLATFWHLQKYKRVITGAGIYSPNWGSPAASSKVVLTDADDADWMARAYGFEGIDRANGMAGSLSNNWPDPWDNHGIVARNAVFADGHAVTEKYFGTPN